jgi:hypothetical protein
MRNKMPIHIYYLIFLSVIAISCNNSTEIKISKHNESESHNNGRNCMDCHNAGGKAGIEWKVAGSCYDSLYTNPYSNATIKFFTEPNGAGIEVASLEVDGKGNFYTTQAIKFGIGLYPQVIGTSGKKLSMNSIVKSGACGSCHNYTTCKIAVK